MAQEFHSEAGPSPQSRIAEATANAQEETRSVARLLGEVVADAQHLVRKELELARHEVKVEVDKARQGAMTLGIGMGVALIGALLLCFMLVHLLVAIALIEFWLSYLIVGGILTLIGVGLLSWGSSRLKHVDPTPQRAVDNVRKDVAWIQEQSPSSKK